MIAQVSQIRPQAATVAPVLDEDTALNCELLFDDLETLGRDINAILRAKDRGSDIASDLAGVIETIKAIAVCQGITKEIFAQNDRLLAQNGLRNSLELL